MFKNQSMHSNLRYEDISLAEECEMACATTLVECSEELYENINLISSGVILKLVIKKSEFHKFFYNLETVIEILIQSR